MKFTFFLFFIFTNIYLDSQENIDKFREFEKKIRYENVKDLENKVKNLKIIPSQKALYLKWSKGLVFYYQSDYLNSYILLDEAFNLALKTNNKFLISEIQLDLAQTLLVNNEVAFALKHLLKVNDFFQKKGTNSQKARTIIALGELYRKTNQLEKSFDVLKSCDLLVKKEPELKARYLNRMAAVKYEQQKPDSAIYYSKLALEIAYKINNIELIATSENEIAAVLQNQDRDKISLKRFKRIEQLWKSIHNLRYAMDARIKQLEIYHLYKIHTKEVLEFAKETENEIIGKNWHDVELHVYDLIHEIYFDFKEYKKADDYLKKYCRAQLNLQEQRSTKDSKISERLYRFEKNQKIIEEQNLLLENQKLKEKTSKSDQQILTIILFSISFILILILVFTLIQSKKKKELANEKLKLIDNNIALNKSLQINDALVQEIHHRVKNNLQSISILVEMQMNQKVDINSNPLLDTYRRITAMVLVHEMLYQQENITGISAINYFKELIQSINEMNLNEDKKIDFNLEIEEIYLNSTKCIALGMITSELISNSVKHAFSGVEFPKIDIELKLDSSKIIFKMKDNGQIYTNLEELKSNLGSQLIQIFVEQLEGVFTLDVNNGFQYTIEFDAVL